MTVPNQPETAIGQSTLQAYLETDYCVAAPSPFVLRVGIANDSLASLYQRSRADCGAFITACNPHSQKLGDNVNAARQAALAQELNQRNLRFFDGIGKHPSGDWPAEPGYFVLGLSLEAAKSLGMRYDQNAILWCGADALPELVLLR